LTLPAVWYVLGVSSRVTSCDCPLVLWFPYPEARAQLEEKSALFVRWPRSLRGHDLIAWQSIKQRSGGGLKEQTALLGSWKKPAVDFVGEFELNAQRGQSFLVSTLAISV
ncbi:MAG: hypothetical protein WAO78_19560, partial [Roseovarius sp.]